MINKPLTRSQIAEIKLDKPHVTSFTNRAKRRERISKRNMVVQVVPIFNDWGKSWSDIIGTKEVLHKKITNLPRQYHGIKARKTNKAVAA